MLHTIREDEMDELVQWLRSAHADSVCDDAENGCLLSSTVDDICEDFGVSRSEFRQALNLVLQTEV